MSATLVPSLLAILDVGSTDSAFLDAAIDISFGFLMLAVLGAFIRVLRGPGAADRVIALDLLAVALVAFAGVYAAESGEIAFLDVSLALALVSFFTTIVFARYIEQRAGPPQRNSVDGAGDDPGEDVS